jgi:hypothetical protein
VMIIITQNPCIYSSFIFLINVSIGIYYQEYIYASLFVALFITSILFHSNPNPNPNYKKIYYFLDIIVIFTIFIYGGYIFYTKNKNKNKNPYIQSFIIATFLTTLYLFFYGYYSNQYCYNINKQVANLYHSLLHIIGSLGHIFIILL